MRTNISFNAGTLILINKINKEFNLFDSLFGNIKGKTKHFIESIKAFINNRLDKCVSLNQIIPNYPQELFECLGFKESPKERTLYRDLERIGLNYKFVIENYHRLIKKFNLVDKEQFVDFSSAYFEGEEAELGALGYSRDSQPGKKQIVFGVQTGINGIPSALTIQKGNVQDKQDMKYNYLSLVPRNNEIYKRGIKIYKESTKEVMYINGIKYKCVKIKDGRKIFYVYHSQTLYKKLKINRNKKFKYELNKNDILIKKV